VRVRQRRRLAGRGCSRVSTSCWSRRVRQVTACGGSLAGLERAVHEELLAVGAAAVQDGLTAISAAEASRHDVTGPDGAPRPWLDPARSRTLTTLFGDVTVTRIAYRGPGVPDMFCADEALDLPAGPTCSRVLEARAAYLEALLRWEALRAGERPDPGSVRVRTGIPG
jgi:hypothetical protein